MSITDTLKKDTFTKILNLRFSHSVVAVISACEHFGVVQYGSGRGVDEILVLA